MGRSYIFVSINYRLLPGADPVTQAHDVAEALAFVEAHLHSWDGASGELVLMGHSAGAHLVALLTADPSIATRAGASPWLGSVALDSGAMDVTQIMRAPHLRLYDEAFGSDPTYWRRASPTDRLQASPQHPSWWCAPPAAGTPVPRAGNLPRSCGNMAAAHSCCRRIYRMRKSMISSAHPARTPNR